MLESVTLILSGLGIGGLLGILVKSVLDKQQLRFTKGFDYKEVRYKAIMILMWVALHPTPYELRMLRKHRPDIKNLSDLTNELNMELHNAMLFASNRVLKEFQAFLDNRTEEAWKSVTRAMKKDLYL